SMKPALGSRFKLTLLDAVVALQSLRGDPWTVTLPLCVLTTSAPLTPRSWTALEPVSTSTSPAPSRAASMSPLFVRTCSEEPNREPLNALLAVVTDSAPETLLAPTAPEPVDI